VAKDKAAGSHVILRIVSVLAVGTVAAALLVGFFFAGDFGAALRWATGQGRFGAGGSLDAATVQVTGSARLDGSCEDAAVADKATAGAEFNARTDAQDLCRNLDGAPQDGSLNLKRVDAGAPVLETVGGKCVSRVEQTYTCLFNL
jgi:hypothetical protein